MNENMDKKARRRTGLFLLFIGVFTAVVAAALLGIKEEDFISVDAVITEITVRGVDPEEYTVMVRYTVDGQEYEQSLGAYDSRWKVGDTLECRYDPENYENITMGSARTAGIVILVCGFALVAAGSYQFGKAVGSDEEEADF